MSKCGKGILVIYTSQEDRHDVLVLLSDYASKKAFHNEFHAMILELRAKSEVRHEYPQFKLSHSKISHLQ